MEKVISIILIIATIYLVMGLLFTTFFLAKGIHKVDEGAHGSPLSFRLIIAPGVIVFWIVLLKKMLNK